MTTLPREAYTSPEWQTREREQLFKQSWVFAGTTNELQKAGDYVTRMCGAYPLVMLMQKDGTLEAYHNVCRHRGAVLLENEHGNAGMSVVCPYHRWTYSLDGALRGVPNIQACFPNLDRGALGLKPASVGVFRDLVFVNPDPEADFEQWIGPIKEAAWPHDISSSELREATPLSYDLKCDWKVFIENAIDGYHLAYLHEDTLGGPVPEENVWERYNDHMVWHAIDGAEGRYRIPAKIREETKKAPSVKHVADKKYGGVYFLFPSTLIVPTPFGFSISSLELAAPGKSKLHVRLWVGPWQARNIKKHIPGFNKQSGTISSDFWTKHPLETGDFQTEDVWICERVQAGLESPTFEPGPLAAGAGAEDPVGWFRQSILRVLSHR